MRVNIGSDAFMGVTHITAARYEICDKSSRLIHRSKNPNESEQ